MSARLFPGFGSGKGTWEGIVKVNSVSSCGRDDLEFGDKVLLPASAFKEVSRLRLPFPLTFQVFNDKAAKTASTSVVPSKTGSIVVANGAGGAPTLTEQFCGVMEFSAPEGQAYIPKWMMGNLKFREGSTARFVTVRDVSFCAD
jgi:hypothetical protein